MHCNPHFLRRLQGWTPPARRRWRRPRLQIRAAFAAGKMAPALRAALAEVYRRIGEPPVAVRSSATAEDLPDMSFAGQQDTFLNVQGLDALCDAVVACWSSLWTARAIGYRERNRVDQASVALAVVVQTMVDAAAAGVLFTANPLNGRRTETTIDATLGLGEALVSGQVEPDHYVVDELDAYHRPQNVGRQGNRDPGTGRRRDDYAAAGKRQPAGDPRCGHSRTGGIGRQG